MTGVRAGPLPSRLRRSTLPPLVWEGETRCGRYSPKKGGRTLVAASMASMKGAG